ncbi:MAG: MFS transporter [Pseudomonas sp.]|uniref:MFS transporter n=1 Tax=Pseudomonas abieticivorans TaxID=2931382 RepID=UPI0020BE6528|nr:MFS transporter [Pseudomonas sp. PIA16]MDE1169354.1 MFS transporter [Pseudomonas sp.]
MKDSVKALSAVCLAAMMFGLEISSIPVILPTLEALLKSRFSDLQWIMNAYTLACTTVLMAVGTLVDRYGRKALFIQSVAVFGLASLACGLADSAAQLIIARAVQGASGGAMLVCQVSILSRQFTVARERSKAFALWGIVFGAGLGLGPIIGTGILALASWQWVFLVHVPIAAGACALAAAGVHASSEAPTGKLDGVGIVLLALAVFGLTYVIIQGSQPEMSSVEARVILSLTLLAFVAFVISQRVNRQPMMDFSVLRIRGFSGALLGSAGMNFSFWPLMIYLPIYVQAGMGLGKGEAGLLLLAYTLPTLFVPPLGERLALKLHPGVVIPAGLLVIGAGLMLMCASIGHAQLLVPGMAAGCLLAGTGLGLTNTPVTNTSTGSVPPTRAGMASGMDMSARMTSLAINIAVMGWILLQGISVGLQQASGGLSDAASLHAAAQAVAAGKQEVPAAAFHAALDLGFTWVLLYGVASVCLAALASFVVFRPWAGGAVLKTA